MNAPQFDNLMDGKTAKFVDLTKMVDNMSGLSGLVARAQSKQATPEEVSAAREEITKQEVVIPGPLRFKIDIFIQQLREQGKPDRFIRRAVQKKFNIQVV